MTIQEAKNKLIQYAQKEIGYHEGANNWNKYAPLWTQAGGWNAQNQPYCDIFADVCFIETFGLDLASKLTYQPIGSFSALCSASAQFYKNNNAWYTHPEVGDQVFFYSGGAINHTGLVETVSGNYFTTIEGNSSDMVARRNYYVGNSYVAGFGRPNWVIFQNEVTIPPSVSNFSTNSSAPNKSEKKIYPLIKRWSSNKVAVRAMQTLLIKQNFSCGKDGADGDFGFNTYEGLKKAQVTAHLQVDGECGDYSWCWLITGETNGENPPILKRSTNASKAVKSAQQLLELNGFSCGNCHDDGEFGNDTYNAVKSFQQKVMRITPTGEIDLNTWKALIGG